MNQRIARTDREEARSEIVIFQSSRCRERQTTIRHSEMGRITLITVAIDYQRDTRMDTDVDYNVFGARDDFCG